MALENKEGKEEFRNIEKVYCLDSVSIFRKFTSFVDTVFSWIGTE